jgi:hypothetical protein
MPDEASLEESVEVLVIAGDDDQLLDSRCPIGERTTLHAPHELVQRALAPAIAVEPNAPQDLDSR